MRIFFLSYQAINLMRGGVTFKTQQLKINLEKLGVDVQFYDSWNLNLKLEKNDLVHIFNANVGTYHMAESLRNYGTKYVVNPIFYNRHNIWKLRAYLKAESLSRQLLKGILSEFQITKTICENAERILPNTEAEGDILVRGIGVDRGKMEVIENGVERRFINSHPNLFIKKYGLKDFILFVGHLGAIRKNGRNIIQALKQIDHPSVIIADVLNNPEGNWCRKEIEKSRNIKLIEWIDHKDPLLESAYAACKTFILPTRYET
ncbi:MAG: glycosyltransferase, partial [Caldisericia bacterium]|nr:glycosyltransferase [Caldisericia bacterium]